MVIQWIDEKHSLQIPDIDNQHKELFLIANRLAEAAESPADMDRFRLVLANMKRLFAYCHFHFNTEEEALRTNGYEFESIANHSILHREFTSRVKNWLEEVREKPRLDLGPILDEVVNWILEHIMVQDRRYADWFAAQGKTLTIHAGHSENGSTSEDALDIWNKKKLGLEIKGIDEQHRELVMILAQANDLLKASKERQRAYLPLIIQKLYYYSQFHFSFEEELMSRHGWAGLPAHRGLHGEFIRKMIDFSTAYNQKRQSLSDEIVLFLKDWTIHHILEEDRKFKDSLKD